MFSPGHALDDGGALATEVFVTNNRGRRVIVLVETACQSMSVFEPHHRTLRHKRQHRVTSITEQRHPSIGPARHRVPVEKAPAETAFRVSDKDLQVPVPAGEVGENPFARLPKTRIRPTIPWPSNTPTQFTSSPRLR